MISPRACSVEGFPDFPHDSQYAKEAVWGLLSEADCIRLGNPEDPSDIRRATTEADLDPLRDNHRTYAVAAGLIATHPCIETTDLLVAEPGILQELTQDVGSIVCKTVVDLRASEPGSKRPYEFVTQVPEIDAFQNITIIGGVTTTGQSLRSIRSLFRPGQDVHAVSFLLDRKALQPSKGSAQAYPLQFHAFVAC